MAVSHIKSDTIADFTGTFTGFNSQGSTTTIAATNVVRPSDWNSVHNQFYTLTGNTTNNSTASGTNVVFAGSGNISVGGTSDTVVISGPAYITGLSTQNRVLAVTATTAPGQGSMWVSPFRANNYISASSFLHMVSYTGTATSNQTNTIGFTHSYALYTAPEGTQTSFSRLWSTSFSGQLWNSGTVSASYAIDTITSSSAGTALLTQVMGLRMETFAINSTLNPGLYMGGFIFSSSSAGNSSLLRTCSPIIDNPLNASGGYLTGAVTQTIGYADGGVYTTTTNAFPNTINMSNDIKQTNNQMPYFKIGAI